MERIRRARPIALRGWDHDELAGIRARLISSSLNSEALDTRPADPFRDIAATQVNDRPTLGEDGREDEQAERPLRWLVSEHVDQVPLGRGVIDVPVWVGTDCDRTCLKLLRGRPEYLASEHDVFVLLGRKLNDRIGVNACQIEHMCS